MSRRVQIFAHARQVKSSCSSRCPPLAEISALDVRRPVFGVCFRYPVSAIRFLLSTSYFYFDQIRDYHPADRQPDQCPPIVTRHCIDHVSEQVEREDDDRQPSSPQPAARETN